MIKKIYIFMLIVISLNAEDTLITKQQNALYVQNMIEIEENIAENFEKYILTEFKIPTFLDLKTNDYLGTNFSVVNKMGTDINFESNTNLKIKYAITNTVDKYIKLLYNRDLYREKTTAFEDTNTLANSYVLIQLQSPAAKNIYDILLSGKTIKKTCTVAVSEPELTNVFCNNNLKTLRWYDSTSHWIEYDKIEFKKGNVTIKNIAMLSDSVLNDLAIGVYIYVQNGSKYIKSLNNQILKVN